MAKGDRDACTVAVDALQSNNRTANVYGLELAWQGDMHFDILSLLDIAIDVEVNTTFADIPAGAEELVMTGLREPQ